MEKKKSKSVLVWFLRLLDSARGMLFIQNPGPAGGGQGRETRARQEPQGPVLEAERWYPAGKGGRATSQHKEAGPGRRVVTGCWDDTESPWNRSWHTGAQQTTRS